MFASGVVLSSFARVKETEKKRFVFVDGLRGIAALWVLAYHFVHPPVLSALTPVSVLGVPLRPLVWLAVQGRLGVQVFFVLSGFVIAHSLSDYALNARSTLLFIARRQVRLDPCYWAALGLATVITFASGALGLGEKPLPAPHVYLAHVLYLQDILEDRWGIKNMLAPSWSLCVEIQLYLVFVLILFVTRTRFLSTCAVFFFAVASLHATWTDQIDHQNWIFSTHWYMFALGALTYWTHRGWIGPWVVALTLCLVIAAHFAGGRPEPVVATLATLLLALASKLDTLTTWFGGRFMQWLGRVSYPLYLVHLHLGVGIILMGCRLSKTPAAIFLWITLATAACFLAAHLLHVLVERPSLKLASRLRPRHEAPSG
jgi:peptidoglycan/LPS O-acetylase OafA/YrhL